MCEDLALWLPVLEFALAPLLTLRALLLPPPATPLPPLQFQQQEPGVGPIICMSKMFPDAAADWACGESVPWSTG